MQDVLSPETLIVPSATTAEITGMTDPEDGTLFFCTDAATPIMVERRNGAWVSWNL